MLRSQSWDGFFYQPVAPVIEPYIISVTPQSWSTFCLRYWKKKRRGTDKSKAQRVICKNRNTNKEVQQRETRKKKKYLDPTPKAGLYTAIVYRASTSPNKLWSVKTFMHMWFSAHAKCTYQKYLFTGWSEFLLFAYEKERMFCFLVLFKPDFIISDKI